MTGFVETFNALGRWLADHLWQMSVELAVLAAVVVAVIFLLRIRSARLRHLFWCLVLAKPVMTLLIASPVSLYWFLRPPAAAPVAAAPAAAGVVSDVPGRTPWPARRPPTLRPAAAAPEAAAPTPAWKMLDRYGVAAGVWSLVAFALGLRLVVGFAYVGFLRRTATLQRRGPVADAAAGAAKALKMRRRVPVALSDVAHGPVLAGIFRPVILLPRSLAAELSLEQIRLVLSHELAHVRRHDNLLLLIQRFAEMCLFFHPVVWLCGWAMRREAEAACDDGVLGACGSSARYADSLTRVAEMRSGLTRRLLVNTFAAAESNLSRRVRRILHGRVARMTFGVSIASVAALIFVGCLGLPTAAERKATQAQTGGKEEAMRKETVAPAPQVKREGGRAWVEGVPIQRGTNSVLAALTSVLRSAGEDVTYEHLMGVSSRAFRLQFNWCPSAPHSYCGFNTAEPALKAVGWSSRGYGMADMGDQKVSPADIARARQAVKASIDAGLPCTFGSKEEGILVGYEPPAEGATGLLRRTKREQPYHAKIKTLPWGVQVYVKLATPAPPRRESILWSLTTAVKNAHAKKLGAYNAGFAAYEAWIAGLEGKGPTDIDKLDEEAWFAHAIGNAWCHESLVDARQAAVKYLRIVAGDFDRETAGHLRKAAEYYKEVVRKVRPGQKYARFPWDLKEKKNWTKEMRQAQAAALKQALPVERKAIAEIEKALAAEGVEVPAAGTKPSVLAEGSTRMASNVKRQGDKVWIEGVEKMAPWGGGRESTFIEALTTAMRAAGEQVDYDYMMGVSGMAFRLHIHQPEWCASAPDAGCGYNCMEAAAGALGYSSQEHRAELGDSEDVDKAKNREAIVRSIEAGVPVVAMNLEGGMDWGVVAGYADGGRKLLCRTKTTRSDGYSPPKKWPWLVFVLGEKTKAPERRETLIASLEIALQVARTPKYEHYASGFAAYEAWTRDLLNDAAFEKLDAEKLRAMIHPNAWCYENLQDARSAAARYLDSIKADFQGRSAAHLTKATDLYKRIAEKLAAGEKHAPFPSQLRGEPWTKQMRHAQAAVLKEALALEKEAIAEIEKALAAEAAEARRALGGGGSAL